MHRRGNSLLTTLVWIALIVVLAFGLAGLTVSHLHTINYQTNRQQAKSLARSVVSTAIARIMADTDFGKTAKPSGLLTVRQDHGVGLLCFESGPNGDAHIPYSTNNLEQTTSAAGSEGRAVPKNSAYLVGIGKVGGVIQRVEAILAVPAFPYAIAASGSVEARGGLTIGALQSIPEGPIPETGTFLPADLLANDMGSQSVFLGQDTSISGDVRAVGQIVLDPDAPQNSIRVKGQLRSNASPEKIPTIDLAHYDPTINGSQFTPLVQASYGNGQTKLGGINRREGDLAILQGLFLDGATLFVHGDLDVQGGLSGRGILAVDGNVTIAGQSDFNSTNGVAVMASHNFKLSGSDPTGSYFQGMIYTEGSFAADKVTLIGSLVAAGDPKPVTLHDTRIFQPPPPAPNPSPGPSTPPPPPPTFDPPPFLTRASNSAVVTGTLTGDSSMLHLQISGGDPPGSLTLDFPPAYFTNYYQTDQAVYNFGIAHNVPQHNITNFLTMIDQYLLDHQPPPPGGGSNPPAVPTAISLINPSNFLKLNERIRITMWKEE